MPKERDRIVNDSWDYWDYIEHGVFPGIDDYLRAIGGHVEEKSNDAKSCRRLRRSTHGRPQVQTS